MSVAPTPARTPSRTRSDLAARILVAIPAIALALVLVVEGGIVLALGLFVFGCICMHELYNLYERTAPVRLAGFLCLAGLIATALYAGRAQVLIATVASLPVIFVIALLRPRPSLAGIAVTLLGVCWIGLGFAHAMLLRELPHGMGVLIDVLVGTFIGDTGAYLGGRLFGRRPLARAVSPNKTVEGLVIGIVCAIVSVWIASRYQAWMPGRHALVLGAGVAIVAPIGDLFESFLKREAQVKDSGNLFGAHGGALDRLDAVLFAVVAGYYIWAAYV